MDNQEAFNKVATHLLTQKVRAVRGPLALCSYRGDDGTMCAVGCLIPQSVYDPRFEGRAADELVRTFKVDALREVEVGLLMELQAIHDAIDPILWHHRLVQTAKDFGLDGSVLDAFKGDAQ